MDFGTLFISKSPYHLEFDFTNVGNNAYDIFIALKNWKNKSETRVSCEPNRFKLQPDQTQKVKFFLCAESPAVGICEEFSIVGSSVSFPLRETIIDSQLIANVIRPAMSFSQSSVELKCFYNEKFNEKVVDITNRTRLPLTVTLKVEGNFFISTREAGTFERKAKLDLQPEQSRRFSVSFDRNAIAEQKATQSFSGKVKAFCQKKLQAVLDVAADVIYPAVEVSTKELDIVSGLLPTAISFTITNVGEMDSTFHLSLEDSSTVITKIEERKQEKLMNIVECVKSQKSRLREVFFRVDEIEDFCLDDEDSLKEENANNLHELSDVRLIESRVTTITEQLEPEPEVALSEIQKYFKSISKSLSEVLIDHEPRGEVLSSKSKSSTGETPRSLLMLSQTDGTLKPKESRLISLSFAGSADGELSLAVHLKNLSKCTFSSIPSVDYHHLPR